MRPWLFATLALLLLPDANAAAEQRRIVVVAIGSNVAPRGAGDQLPTLHYADDDAAAVYELAHDFAQSAILLTVLDKRSQRRYPRAAAVARPPTMAELSVVVKRLARQIAAAKQQGISTELIFYFSGHGTRAGARRPAMLHLADGGITRQWLYDKVFAAIPATYIHVFVDACHAETVIRPRDGSEVSARVVDVDHASARRWVRQTTLARFPNVGAVIATSSGEKAHEWDVYEQGIFTYQVLSGLRGAADVNGDQQIEYSELHAFLAAANRSIVDPRARLRVLVRAPKLNRRIPLIDLRRATKAGWLTGAVKALGHFYVEREDGRRVADVHLENDHRLHLLVPAAEMLFVRSASGEASLRVEQGGQVDLARLSFAPNATRSRGALVSALKRGLFQTAFGPRYYRGFVDASGDVAVNFVADRGPVENGRSKLPAALAFVSSGALVISAAVLGGLALDARSDYEHTDLHRPAAEARDRYDRYRIGFFVTLGAGVAAGVLGAVLYPWRGGRARAAPVGVAASSRGAIVAWTGSF